MHMANVPNYNDLQRLRRQATNDVTSYKMVMQKRGASQATVFDPQAGLPAYQKNGWNLSFSVTVSSATGDNADTKTLVTFDPNGGDVYTNVLYAGAAIADLRYGQYPGPLGWLGYRWYVQAQGGLFYTLSTAGDVEFKTTPTKNGVSNNPPVSVGVWVCYPAFDCVSYPLSALYIQPIY